MKTNKSDQATQEHSVDALEEVTEEGRSRLRKVSGRGQTPADPGMSEWRNPTRMRNPLLNT